MTKVKTRKDAEALWCPQCKVIIGDSCQPYWDMSKTKRMHEDGTRHAPYYIKEWIRAT